jgi:hypothetical protein
MADKAPEHRIPGVAGTEQGYTPAQDPTRSVNSPASDPGKAYLTRTPGEADDAREHVEEELDEAVEETFPASDPIAVHPERPQRG